MKKIIIYIASLCFILLSACEYEQLEAPHVVSKVDYIKSVYTSTANVTINSSIWKNADYFVVPLNNLSINNLDNTKGVLNSEGTYNGLSSFNYGDSTKLTIKSVYNDSYIYILAEWNDTVVDVSNKSWFWNGPTDPRKTEDTAQWTSQLNDDKLVLKFDNALSPGSIQDIWMWSMALSEPLGYAIDMSINSGNVAVNDNGTPMYARNGNSNTTGPLYEFDGNSQIFAKSDGKNGTLDATYFLLNKTPFVGNPDAGDILYHNTCAECHGGGTEIGYAPLLTEPWLNTRSRASLLNFILDPELHQDAYSHVAGFSDTDFDNIFAYLRGQSGVPGYYLQIPSGSVADIRTSTNVTMGKINPNHKVGYKVLFVRKIDTGNTDDVAFDTKTDAIYNVCISLSNKDSLNYVGALNQKLEFKKNWNEK